MGVEVLIAKNCQMNVLNVGIG